MSAPKHTPGPLKDDPSVPWRRNPETIPAKTPWKAGRPARDPKAGVCLTSANGEMIGGVTWDSDAARIVACVNACEGLADPSVVPTLVELLRDLLGDLRMAGPGSSYNNADIDHLRERAAEAIARAEARK